jgi:hypothetical protein
MVAGGDGTIMLFHMTKTIISTLKLRIIAVDITADFASPSMTIEEF